MTLKRVLFIRYLFLLILFYFQFSVFANPSQTEHLFESKNFDFSEDENFSSNSLKVGPIVIDFEVLQKKANTLFQEEKIHKHACETLKKIEELNQNINNDINLYNEGSLHFKDIIIEKVHCVFELFHKDKYPIYRNYPQASSLDGFFMSIREIYQDLEITLTQKETFEDNVTKRLLSLYDEKKTELFNLEQKEFHSSSIFQSYLEVLAKEFDKFPHQTVYFVYAWPSDERHEKEYWLQMFLKSLHKALKTAGFPRVFLDIVSNRYGNNINQFMKEAETSGYVLLFGTESLIDKYKKGLSAVCIEINHILRKREEDNKKGLPSRVFPILLSGQLRESFPENYERFSTIRDWRSGEEGYLHHFQQLFIELLGLPPEKWQGELKRLWDENIKSFPSKETEKLRPDWYAKKRKEIEAYKRQKSLEGIAQIQLSPNQDSPEEMSRPFSFSESIESLSNHLREFYKEQRTAVYKIRDKGSWKLFFPVEAVYTDLLITEKPEQKEEELPPGFIENAETLVDKMLCKQIIRAENIFNSTLLKDHSKKKYMIFGSAGAGKTTFCQKVAYNAKEWWPKFETAFLIKLRNLSEAFYAQEVSAYDIISRECNFDLKTYKQLLEDPNFRSKTLLILDGYDELPKEAESGFLREAFNDLKSLFPYILMTSRHMMVDFSYDKELELQGFADPQNYIQKLYDELYPRETATAKAEKLQIELKKRPTIFSLAKHPLHLTFICTLFNENENFFDEKNISSATSLYNEIVIWFYKRFQLRCRKSLFSEASIRMQSNPRLTDEKVSRLAEALEMIAWESTSKKTPYCEQEELELILAKKSLALDDLSHLGLVTIEDHKGQFIHFTYQEYFAATYLAQFYLRGCPENGDELLREIKLNPHYNFMLSLAAGFIARQKNLKALEDFFNALFSKPHDLAESYELQLLSRCFGECPNPESISFYPEFIARVIDYIRMGTSFMNSELLKHNLRLLEHPVITNEIVSLLENTSKRNRIVETLVEIAIGSEYLLSDAITEALLKILCSEEIDTFSRVSMAISQIFEKLAKIKVLPKYVIKRLEDLICNHKLSLHVRRRVIFALVGIGEAGETLSDQSIKALIEMICDKDLDKNDCDSALLCLPRLIREGQIFPEKLLQWLIKIIVKEGDEINEKIYAALILGEIGGAGQKLPQSIIERLIQMVNNKKLSRGDRTSIACALGLIALDGQMKSERAIQIIVGLLREKHFRITSSWCSYALKRMIAGGFIPEESLKKLIEMGDEKESKEHSYIMMVIEAIAVTGKAQSKEAFNNLTRIVCDKSFHQDLRGFAAGSMGSCIFNMDKSQILPEEVLTALIEMMEDSSLNEFSRGVAAYPIYASYATLRTSEKKQALPEETWSALANMILCKELNEDARFWSVLALEQIHKGRLLSEELLSELLKLAYHESFLSHSVSNILRTTDISHLSSNVKENVSYKLIMQICCIICRPLYISGHSIVIKGESIHINQIDSDRLNSFQMKDLLPAY